MAWLRIDDGFATHPKIASLTDREFRVWMRLMCYCGRHQDPTVDTVTRQEVVGLTQSVVRRFVEVDLVDSDGTIHDWSVYQPRDSTGADRQAKWRANRNGKVTP